MANVQRGILEQCTINKRKRERGELYISFPSSFTSSNGHLHLMLLSVTANGCEQPVPPSRTWEWFMILEPLQKWELSLYDRYCTTNMRYMQKMHIINKLINWTVLLSMWRWLSKDFSLSLLWNWNYASVKRVARSTHTHTHLVNGLMLCTLQHHRLYFLNQTIVCWNKPLVCPLFNAYV